MRILKERQMKLYRLSMLLVILFTGVAYGEANKEPRTVLFLGDSLTAGYGLDPSQAYPVLIQEKIEAAGLNYRAVNGGLSGETSAGGLRRINWMLRRQIDVLVLALGANDGLRGLDLDNTRNNLQAIIDKTRRKYPEVKIVIAGMKVPPNMGKDYAEGFERIFSDLAEKNGTQLIPFLLEDVAAVPELNQPDAIHPNAEGQKVVADTVWQYLEPVLTE